MSQILVIQPVHPLPDSSINIPEDRQLPLTVHITLGCGCPTCSGGRWNATRFRVKARISNAAQDAEASLAYSGRTSEFTGRLPVNLKGPQKIEVTAIDPDTGLAGRVFINFKIT